MLRMVICCSLILFAAPTELISSASALNILITSTQSTAGGNGVAQAGVFPSNDNKTYPDPLQPNPVTSTTIAPFNDGRVANASTSDGSANSSSNLTILAATPFIQGVVADSLNTLSVTSATGLGSIQMTGFVDGGGFTYNANGNATSNAKNGIGTGLTGPTVTIGVVYAAVGGGGTSSNSDWATSQFNAASNATATIDQVGVTVTLGTGTQTAYQRFVVINDNIPDINAVANTAANVNGSGSVIEGIGSALSQATAHAVSGAWVYILPVTPAPAGTAGISSIPLDGDNNFDGELNALDIDALALESRTHASASVFSGANPLFDMNLDQSVGYSIDYSGGVSSDSDYLIRTLLDTEYGDANLDGLVNDDDKLILFSHWGATGGFGDGDFTGDGLINGADYTVWRDFEGFAAGSAMTVPEPSSACLALFITAGIYTRRRF